MAERITFIRNVESSDYSAWREMWAGYCEFYETTVPEDVTLTTWNRILDTTSMINGIIAVDTTTETAVGFANYVLHPHTWSAKTLCYMEDLYVRPEARGANVGHALIEHLLKLGKEHDWNRVYWHTNNDNLVARRLYDRFNEPDAYVRYTVSLPSKT